MIDINFRQAKIRFHKSRSRVFSSQNLEFKICKFTVNKMEELLNIELPRITELILMDHKSFGCLMPI